MKKVLAALLALGLMLGVSCATAETARQLEDGHYNVIMDNGYLAYDTEYQTPSGDAGAEYTVKATDEIGMRRLEGLTTQDAAQMLKYLFVHYYDEAIEKLAASEGLGRHEVQKIIWQITSKNCDYVYNYNAEIVNAVRQNALLPGNEIPDHGHEKQLDDATTVIFDFIGLDSKGVADYGNETNVKINNLFGYKVRYRVTGEEGKTATLKAPALFYNQSCQWQKKQANGSYEDIDGATGQSYTTPVLTAKDDGSDYRCVYTQQNSTGSYAIDVEIVIPRDDAAGAGDPPKGGDLPKTGDPSMLMGWSALLLASAAGLGLKIRKRR